VQILAEEVLPMQRDHTSILLELSYSEKDETLMLECSGTGAPYNPLECKENDMAVTMLKALCEKVEYLYSENRNTMLLQVRK
jgi:hypothetical protein